MSKPMTSESFLRKIIKFEEEHPETKKKLHRIDYGSFASAAGGDLFLAEIAPLFADKTLEPVFGKGGRGQGVESVRLLDLPGVYRHLRMEPIHVQAEDWRTELSCHAEPWESGVIEAIVQSWLVHKPWGRIASKDIETVKQIQALARAIRTGEWKGIDHRTVCSRIVGNSKFLESRGASVFSYLFHGEESKGLSLREIIDALGLQKAGHPVLVSGPFALCDFAVGERVEYLGVGDQDLGNVTLSRVPTYILTIENRESYYRHIAEVNADRDALVIFTGGQPSHNVQTLFKHIIGLAPDNVPVYHWSDIDQGGIEIFTMMQSLCPRLQPHLMSADILVRHGTPSEAIRISSMSRLPDCLSDALAILTSDAAMTLEQEVLDPIAPASYVAGEIHM